MRKTLLTLAIGLALIVLASCSMEKRHYLPGYHVDWNQNTVKNTVTKKEAVSVISQSAAIAAQSAFVEEKVSAVQPQQQAQQPNAVAKIPAVSKIAKAVQSVKANPASVPSLKGTDANKSTISRGQQSAKPGNHGPDNWVYILLIFLVPFGTTISMYLYEGKWTKRCTTNLLLTLLCGIPGIIHACIVIFGNK